MLETVKTLTFSFIKLAQIPPILSFIHPWLHLQIIIIPLRFGWNPISRHLKVILNCIKPVIEKRLNDKKRLGDAWVAPLWWKENNNIGKNCIRRLRKLINIVMEMNLQLMILPEW
ncbi:cytochrome P450 [Gigaspora margarita]|uniref:Cytochrome P450 n=1 Tax=Gigaspora margarita TaxID=4874 RepID=A0A8H4B4F6_GIGMA|nr:cytochrome P450 [Gigaspora margarita]